jgi:cytochrome c biogenesis protein CcdA
LTANLAAISFLSRRAGRPRRVLLAGLLYALGGVLAYVLLGILLVAGLLSSAPAANFLNRSLHALLGPLLIAAGLVLLGWLPLSFGAWLAPEKLRALAEKGYLWSAGLLGFLFALTFCPTTAGYFFGSLLPLAVKHHSTFLLPALYGLAAGLPVTLFAILVAVATQAAGKWFNSLSRVESWLRGACGLIFILLGIYYALLYVFGVGAAQA